MKTHLIKLTVFVVVMLSCVTAIAGVCQHPSLAKGLVKGVADSLSITNTSIAFGDKVLLHDMDISIAALDSTAVPELNYGMFNVSVEGEGYRFLPHGTHFDGEGATVRLKYDRTRIPSGYTEDDIRTYYFDQGRKCWVALPRVEVDKQSACVVSKTTHFTDMINGVIVAPESPETSDFTPTMMNDIKAADPTSKINIIMPPTANNRGSANLTYPFEMPPARNGMQPQVALSYNSDGGSGWAGEGWDISIPTISVDTRWGVPRYNPDYETETYLLNGQMLAMMNGNEMTVAHRQYSIPRDSIRQFFLRQGGDFSKIVRKGKSLDSCYWEITDRNGVVYTYGGNSNAVLKDSINDTTGYRRAVIAEWKLTRIQEIHGDYIEYNYSTKDIPLYNDALSAKEICLSNIKAGNTEQDFPHTIVEFVNNNHPKTMRLNNARYGFLTTSTQLLDHVTIMFKPLPSHEYEVLRTYALTYQKDTTFHKDVLTKITQLKGEGVSNNPDDTVSFQVFDYYKDVVTQDDAVISYSNDADTVQLSDDTLYTGKITALIPSGDFSSHVTALGGSKSSNMSTFIYGGIGEWDHDITKRNTIGLSASYRTSNTDGVSTLIDIDGDGLLDKVFVKNEKLWYRSGLTSDAKEIQGISKFSHTRANTIGGGYKWHVPFGRNTLVHGSDIAVSEFKTDVYFADVNADGLMDIVHKKKVYFNCPKYVNGELTPYFSLSSSESPSPIIATGTIDTSDTEISQEEKRQLVENSPMIDMVRVWVAQYDGSISISGDISLLPPNEDDEDGADGIYYSIQLNNEPELLLNSIDPNDFSRHNDTISTFVHKGDMLFFRLQSGRQELSNGSSDRVEWNPIITYINKPILDTPNGHKFYTFDSKESEVASDTTLTPFFGENRLFLKGTFYKDYTSDSVTISVYTSGERFDAMGNPIPFNRHKVYTRDFGCNDTLSGELTVSLDYYTGDKYIECEVYSTSNVAWDKVKWIPVLVSEKDSTLVSVSYSIYADNIVEGNPMNVTENDTLTIGIQGIVENPSEANGDLTFTIKSKTKLYSKKVYHVYRGVITNDEPITITPEYDDLIWLELFTDNRSLANAFYNPDAVVSETTRLSSRYQIPSNINSGPFAIVLSSNERSASHVTTNLFTKTDETRFGSLYRGWGQFAYNACSDTLYNARIKTNLLNMDYTPSNEQDTMDIKVFHFYSAIQDKETQSRWYGPNRDIFITGTEMGCSRLGVKNVNPDNLLAGLEEVSIQQGTKWRGSTARGYVLCSKNESHDTFTEGDLNLNSWSGSLAFNHANGFSRSKLSYFDMNGDGYPDIITPKKIQYTNTLGGISGEAYNDSCEIKGTSSLLVLSPGGSAEHAFSIGSNTGINDNNASLNQVGAQSAENGTQTSDNSLDFGMTLDYNSDNSVKAFVDVNGDGLPDKIFDNGEICINLGYSFSDVISFGANHIQQTNSTQISPEAGIGVPFPVSVDTVASSFSAGIGLAFWGSAGQYDLIDMNGDGLVDIVEKGSDNLLVCLNTGDAFAPPINWINADEISNSSSTSESYNSAYTITFPVPFPPSIPAFKIAINQKFSYGTSMTRPRYELRDIDGDGFLDILKSDRESQIYVKRSTIARTNKLKAVTNSLGGIFTIDYKHTTPTYGLPCGKWVMSCVDVDYGIHFKDGENILYEIPNSKTVYEYKGGRRDRHEREFLGFAEVISKQLNTKENDDPYRKTIERYDTASIYTSGNLISTCIENANGRKFTEEKNNYYFYGVTNQPIRLNGGVYNYSSDFDKWNDRGVAYAPLKYTKNIQYDASGNSSVLSEAYNQYFVREGDHGLLRSYKFSNNGSLDSVGNGDYNYETKISYHSKLSGSNYIFGLPDVVRVWGKNDTLFHEVKAEYDTTHYNQIIKISRLLNARRSFLPINPMDGLGGNENGTDGQNGITPNPYNPSFPDKDMNEPQFFNRSYAITNYHYDNYGNLDSVCLPEGSDHNRVWYKYLYEDTLKTYLKGVEDVFGLHSHALDYDYRYGITNYYIDQNDAKYRTENDDLGRLISISSPNEDDDSIKTITFEYYPKATFDHNGIIKPAYAVTTYIFRQEIKCGIDDFSQEDQMKIVTFVDGFGRVIETRKESNIHNQ